MYNRVKSDNFFNRLGLIYLSCGEKLAFSLLNSLKDIISGHVSKFCDALNHLLDIVSKVLLIRLDFLFYVWLYWFCLFDTLRLS